MVKDKMEVVQKAGSILINTDTQKICLIYREKQNDYSFAKGHRESNETLKQCAIRETEEETSRACRIIETPTLPTLTYTDSKANRVIAHYFIAKDMGTSQKKIKQGLSHETVWLNFDEVQKRLSHKNLIDFWINVKGIVKGILDKNS